jgi:branched-chain amino acid aminotransferase
MLFIVVVPWPDISSYQGPGDGPRRALRLLASEKGMTRAWPGGSGYAKLGANYAPTLNAQSEAQVLGYDQVLWLHGENGEVTESGGSNFFVVWKEKANGELQLVTAPLHNNLILPGITRRSVLDLVGERLATRYSDGNTTLEAVAVVERIYTMQDIVEAADEGRLVEAFTTGTSVRIAFLSLACPIFLSMPLILGIGFRLVCWIDIVPRVGNCDSHNPRKYWSVRFSDQDLVVRNYVWRHQS